MTLAPRVERIGSVVLRDFEPPRDLLCEDAYHGLTSQERSVPPKYFYDARGARLFERICELEEYYLTRTELGILRQHARAIADRIGARSRVVEFGSGSGVKTRILLENLEAPVAYVPVDISRGQLVAFATSIAEQFPALDVLPVCADYTGPFTLPEGSTPAARTCAFFPGSTIGNFSPAEAEHFLARVRDLCGSDGALLLGADLQKDAAVIQNAYDDAAGVTAEFNLNLLRRLNRECGTDFDVVGFRHHAFYDSGPGRVEMRLVSRRRQTVRVPSPEPAVPAVAIEFGEGDHITTEYSYKYTRESLSALSARAGWRPEGFWTDSRGWFGIWLFAAA